MPVIAARGALGDLDRAVMVCAGKEHSLVLLRSGKLVGFGNTTDGALGVGFGAAGAQLSPAPVRASGLECVATVACGSHHPGGFLQNTNNASAALCARTGALYTWGAARPWLGRDTEGSLSAAVEPDVVVAPFAA